ncbi:serine/threonine protein kinase [Luteolibacter ambystomatis]|uniref:Serine/threonine protein kinase n=1 Tax=Luteolibacter ambystomatis TaxID=2824561 RepID=A0A975IYN7_9BACT|nr:serine/threonine-protein kinase [Luteolibacter ambystomatis]QUE50581.1 serine/threonine protein kinase [Luteolibacter ambystomatis]
MSLPSSFDAPAPETLAAHLPAYDFEVLIASDVTGAVYKARQKSLDRDVAVKFLPAERLADPKVRQAFENGARVLAKLNHPNLISVFDFGDIDGTPYVVMEFVPGKSLQRSASGKQIHPVQAAELVIGICQGLAHAHDNGVIHRDLKPANILLNQKAQPKIGDFGLADLRETGAENQAYIAPEVLSQPRAADRRSDIYSVGVILYTLLAGKEPHAGSPPPSAVCDVDAGLDHIWQRATQPNPGLRYPDCHEFAADLSEWHRMRTTGKAAVIAEAPAGPAGAPKRMPAQRVEEDELVIPAKSGSGGWLVNLILLGILGAGGYYAWQKFGQPASQADAPTQSAPAEPGKAPGSRDISKLPLPAPGAGSLPDPNGGSPFGKPVPGTDLSGPDAAGGTPGKTAQAANDPLTVKARELIADAEKERTKSLGDNVRNFFFDIDGWARSLPNKEQVSRKADVDKLKGAVRDSRVPVSVPSSHTLASVPNITKAVSRAADKQKQIDAEYATKVGRYRDLYVSKMKVSIDEATQKGEDATGLNRNLEAAAELSGWIDSLGGKLQPENPVLDEPNEYKGIFGPTTNPFGTPIK